MKKTFIPVTAGEWALEALVQFQKALAGREQHAGVIRLDTTEIRVPLVQSCAEPKFVKVLLMDDGKATEFVRIPSHLKEWPVIVSGLLEELAEWRASCQACERKAG